MPIATKIWDGLQPYETTWQAMRTFVQTRTPETPDTLWILEHPPVFTQGLAGKPEYLLDLGDIPLVQSDRGGQVTYHGPGLWMLYWMYDLRRANTHVRALVCALEEAIIAVLATYGISAHGDRSAPGIYVEQAKIASIGLRIRQGSSYHGVCLNVEGDLSPFQRIHPCGVRDRVMTQIHDFHPHPCRKTLAARIIQSFEHTFGQL